MSGLRAVLAACALGGWCVVSHSAAEVATREPERPIIAQLLSDPASYAGRQVIVYGLVIESISDAVFLLQDVSQRPLKVVAAPGRKIAVGDQLTVTGEFDAQAAPPVLHAVELVPTRVLGGGGCC
ncbi:hypothetical protein [Pseudorhodoplanes sp.]|uniref:hypothetical protein n=1 Tax=Pseudorhodoplanes sp. TaxID=1934341 RepID=UPI003D1354B9